MNELTHEAISLALTNDDPLTHNQRASLLSLVADDKFWQREYDKVSAELLAMSDESAAPTQTGAGAAIAGMQRKYPCPKCNMDEGSPICLQDERCPGANKATGTQTAPKAGEKR